jgi:hypothetical protein
MLFRPFVVVAVAAAIATATAGARPPEGAPPAPPSGPGGGNVEHGRYLVERVAFCIECHSPRDEQGVIIPGREFTGAPIPFRPHWPNDWAERAPRNRGLPGYTPELGLRLLMMGAIEREGRQLRPPMPRFRMTPQDAADVYAYMSSLQ